MKNLNQKGALDWMLVVTLGVVLLIGGVVLYRVQETDETVSKTEVNTSEVTNPVAKIEIEEEDLVEIPEIKEEPVQVTKEEAEQKDKKDKDNGGVEYREINFTSYGATQVNDQVVITGYVPETVDGTCYFWYNSKHDSGMFSWAATNSISGGGSGCQGSFPASSFTDTEPYTGKLKYLKSDNSAKAFSPEFGFTVTP